MTHYRLLLMTIIINNIVFANSIKIQTEVDTSIATIGDVINWNVFTEKTSKKINFPNLVIDNDTLSIKSQKAIIKNDDIVGRAFELTFWDTGFFYTPNYIVNVLDEKGASRVIDRIDCDTDYDDDAEDWIGRAFENFKKLI